MSVQQSYYGLARLLEYPQGKEELVRQYEEVAAFLRQSDIESPAERFIELVRGSSLSELQEEYVAHFDFNPASAPYLGHHLYGDNQKKSGYMIQVKQEYQRHDFTPPEEELPDHLAVLFDFLAHLSRRGEEEARREFAEKMVLPGLNKLLGAHAPRGLTPWLTLVEAAELICSADCREVATC